MLSLVEVAHVEPSQLCMYPASNHVLDDGCNGDIPCIECNSENEKPIACAICGVKLQPNVLQNNLQSDLSMLGVKQPCTHI